jgi:hypothetical protein
MRRASVAFPTGAKQLRLTRGGFLSAARRILDAVATVNCKGIISTANAIIYVGM